MGFDRCAAMAHVNGLDIPLKTPGGRVCKEFDVIPSFLPSLLVIFAQSHMLRRNE